MSQQKITSERIATSHAFKLGMSLHIGECDMANGKVFNIDMNSNYRYTAHLLGSIRLLLFI
jgi:hypothetical protein